MRPNQTLSGRRRGSTWCRRAILAVSLVPLGACLDFSGLEIFGSRLVGVWVTPENVVVAVGDTARMEAMGQIDGIMIVLGAYDPLPDAVWSISDPTIARLEPVQPPAVDSFPRARVRLRGLKPGQAVVSVSARHVTGTAEVRVVRAGLSAAQR